MNPIPYKITEIKAIDFYIDKDVVSLSGDVQVTSQFSFTVNTSENLICCNSIYSYKQNNCKLMGLDLNCIFKVEENVFKSLIANNVLTIEVDFLRYMATICVGTARGEIHARAENSIISNIILPPINLVKAITQDAKFQVNPTSDSAAKKKDKKNKCN